MSQHHRRSSKNKRFFEKNRNFRQNDRSYEWLSADTSPLNAATTPAIQSMQAPPLSENPFIKREVQRLFDASQIKNTVASQERRLGRLETIHNEQQEFIADARPALQVMHENQLKLADKIEEMVVAQNRAWDELANVQTQCQRLYDMNYEAAKVIDALTIQLKEFKQCHLVAAPASDETLDMQAVSEASEEFFSAPLAQKISSKRTNSKASNICEKSQSAVTKLSSAVLAARIAHDSLTPRLGPQKSARI